MDPFEKLDEQSALLLDAYKDFRDAIEELKSEVQGQYGEDGFSISDPRAYEMASGEEEDDDGEEESEDGINDIGSLLASAWRDLNSVQNGEFPGRAEFDAFAEDPDDGTFYGGKDTGIPVGLLVRTSDGDGKLLPIYNGLFNSDGEY